MVVIDGSQGEGGGQILRTSLSLAALLGREVRLENIRAHRPRPGLRPQHLTAVRALAAVTRARVSGAEVGSIRLSFHPRGIFPGHYTFDVAERTGSAGSVCLVAQTLLPVLIHAPRTSVVTLKGGTHVPWSPSAHYLRDVFLPALTAMGITAAMELRATGWYPQGGGEICLTVAPAPALRPITWRTPPRWEEFQGLSAVAHLPEHIMDRQKQRLADRLARPLPIATAQLPGRGQGSLVFVWGPRAGFAALGAKGKPAETVADEAAKAFRDFLASGAAVDLHLADQLCLYLTLASGPCAFTTAAVTSHLVTNVRVIAEFLGEMIQVRGSLGEPGEVQGGGKKGRTARKL